MSGLPSLLLDVDGVINVIGAGVDGILDRGLVPHDVRAVTGATYRMLVAPETPDLLERLATQFEIVWCTTWANAPEAIAPLVGLPADLRAVTLPRALPRQDLRWSPKTSYVRQWAAAGAVTDLAWIDDDVTAADQAALLTDFSSDPSHPLAGVAPLRSVLTVPIDPNEGLVPRHVPMLAAFATQVAARVEREVNTGTGPGTREELRLMLEAAGLGPRQTDTWLNGRTALLSGLRPGEAITHPATATRARHATRRLIAQLGDRIPDGVQVVDVRIIESGTFKVELQFAWLGGEEWRLSDLEPLLHASRAHEPLVDDYSRFERLHVVNGTVSWPPDDLSFSAATLFASSWGVGKYGPGQVTPEPAADAVKRMPNEELPPGCVMRLEPGSSGRWNIHTRSAVHVLDLDAHTYERLPGPASGDFVTDGMVHEFNNITPPEVGSPMVVWFDDMDHPDLRERWHRTSRVRRIERAQTPEGSTD